jgi:uncharacterized protein
MENIVKTLLFDWLERKLPQTRHRSYNLEKITDQQINKILVLTGFRRIGKTYLLYSFANEKLKTITKKELIYLNFEDERIPRKTEFLTQLLPSIQALFGDLPKFLLLDEIQVIPEWSKWLRRIHETTDIRIIVTGSNSKMSSFEIPTELRGRFIENHINPLNFIEFIEFKNFSDDLTTLEHNQPAFSRLKLLLNEYLYFGGLPEVVLADESIKNDIVQSYFRTVVSQDISEHFSIRNDELLRQLIRLMLNQRSFTVNKLYNTLKSTQYTSSKNTLIDYLGYIKSSYFYNYLVCFSYSIKDELKHPRKLYCIDNAFITCLSTQFSKNIGMYYENVVARHLLNLGKEIYYWKSAQDSYEVDFVIKDDMRVNQLVQVTYQINDADTLNREVRALIKSSEQLNCKNLYIINEFDDRKQTFEWFGTKAEIQFLPLWKFLLFWPKNAGDAPF